MKLELKSIYKSFGAGNVLDGVDFEIQGGEICALLGENGAGKSTLMNIVGGVFPADFGDIYIDGNKASFLSCADSLSAGIGFIHQDLNLVNDLTVYENMFLSGFEKKGIFLDKKEMIRRSAELFSHFGMDIDPMAKVSELDASYKQMVAIARVLLGNASLIIMDEPTTSLTGAEIDRLFSIMRTLRDRGIAIIFISHKLREVMEICDRYTVLRNGKQVSCGRVSDVTARQIACDMVGRDFNTDTVHTPASYGETVLSVNNFSDGKNFFDISFSVKQGQILGFTGLLGDGRSEIFETLFGIHAGSYTGEIVLNGESIHPKNTVEALSKGIAYLPKNRHENAIIPDMSIVDNATLVILDKLCKIGHLDFSLQKEKFLSQAEVLKIKMPDIYSPITDLSGGNQQKVVLAKWLLSDLKVLILDNPTQGVDVGAKEEIYSIVEKLAGQGIAIIVLSNEAQEIIRLCENCVVMFHGHAVDTVSGESMNEQTMMRLATGAGKEMNG